MSRIDSSAKLQATYRSVTTTCAIVLVAACGGGGSSDGEAPAPPPEPIDLIDSVPAPEATVNRSRRGFNLAHLANEDWYFSYGGNCTPVGVAVRRTLIDLSPSSPQAEVVDQKLDCALGSASRQQLRVDARDGDGTRYRAELAFAVESGSARPHLETLESQSLSRHRVDALYVGYVRDEALDFIDSSLTRSLAAAIIYKLSRLVWEELGARNANFGTLAERVSYSSRSPSGEDAMLTGLVVRPLLDGQADFSPPSRVILLNHGTGSTPSGLDPSDVSYLFANILASRGFLVVAPDNWGRGGGDGEDLPETYLMANRVAHNSSDLLELVIKAPDYQAFRKTEEHVELVLAGYSQGAHSALATWLGYAARETDARVREIHIGGGPFDPYKTLRGALQRAARRCDGNQWCAGIDGDAVLHFAVNRVMPGYMRYLDTQLELSDIVTRDGLTEKFVTGMLGADDRFDRLKMMLQLNSFTNLIGLADSIRSTDTSIFLYHARHDRLVTHQNSLDLEGVLAPDFALTDRFDACDGNFYDRLDDLEVTGLVHSICAFEMFDRVLRDLRSSEAVGGWAPRESSHTAVPWLELAVSEATEALADTEQIEAFRVARTNSELRSLSEQLRAIDLSPTRRLADRLDKK